MAAFLVKKRLNLDIFVVISSTNLENILFVTKLSVKIDKSENLRNGDAPLTLFDMGCFLGDFFTKLSLFKTLKMTNEKSCQPETHPYYAQCVLFSIKIKKKLCIVQYLGLFAKNFEGGQICPPPCQIGLINNFLIFV